MVLLKDIAMGVFCNRDMYLARLKESINKYFPDIPLIEIRHEGTILDGYFKLMGEFEKTDKRFYLWMDDDIVILNPDIVKNALELIFKEKYAVAMAYMTHNSEALTAPYDATSLKSRMEKVMMGYFMIVDSWKVKGIKPDGSLPYPNISVETDYGLAIQASGHLFGIVNDYVYHQHKEDKNPYDGYLKTNEYLKDKWGNDFYSFNIQYDGYLVNLPAEKK